jgi:O-acetylserine/cysteine efflux transporter
MALAVVTVWGSNFVVIKLALAHVPPLALATLRYALALLPAAFFLARPPLPWQTLALYGIAIGVGQFGLLFLAMSGAGLAPVQDVAGHAGGWISPGMASLVVQTQVFFTLGLAMLARGERLRRHQAAGLAVAVTGLAVIGVQAGGADGSVTPLGLALVLAAALSWAIGNVVVMRAPRVDMLAFVVWSSAFAVPPLALLSWWFEGWPAVSAGLAGADASAWMAVVWQAVGNTLFGYAAWGWLLARHPAALVSPLALLVPVVGMAASTWWLAEPMPGWKLAAAALVLAGLAVHLLGGRGRAA